MPIELPLKPKHLHPTAKRQKSTSSQAGTTGGKKHKITNGLGALQRQEMVKAAQIQTAQNKKILYIDATGKRRFIFMSEYEAR